LYAKHFTLPLAGASSIGEGRFGAVALSSLRLNSPRKRVK